MVQIVFSLQGRRRAARFQRCACCMLYIARCTGTLHGVRRRCSCVLCATVQWHSKYSQLLAAVIAEALRMRRASAEKMYSVTACFRCTVATSQGQRDAIARSAFNGIAVVPCLQTTTLSWMSAARVHAESSLAAAQQDQCRGWPPSPTCTWTRRYTAARSKCCIRAAQTTLQAPGARAMHSFAHYQANMTAALNMRHA